MKKQSPYLLISSDVQETNQNLHAPSDIMIDNLYNIEKPNCDNCDLELYFKDKSEDAIYIFPYSYDLYLLIQKRKEWFEEAGTLIWNEISNFGDMERKEEIMFNKISNLDPIFNKIKELSKINKFDLYKIPIYLIPLVKETYIPQKYGDRVGDWKVYVHYSILESINKLQFETKPQFTLRTYQKNAVMEWEKNGYFGTLSLATAGGKTIIALSCISSLGVNTLIAVPTETLVLQWRNELIVNLKIPENQVGIFYGKVKQLRPIVVGTYTSLMKYINFTEDDREKINKSDLSQIDKETKIRKREEIESFMQTYYSFLILDEAHHIPAPTFRSISLHSKALYRLSLSATIKRYDGNESLLFFTSGKILFELDYLSLCEQKFVAPFLYFYIPVILSESEEKKYRNYGNDFEGKKRMTYFNSAKEVHILTICSHHVNINREKVLIFTSYVSDAFSIKSMLQSININADVILSVDNQKKYSNEKRDSVIKKFKDGDLDVIISTTVLDEGFNVPDASVGIIVSGTSSERQMVQRIGRLVRMSNVEKSAYIYEITTEAKNIATIDFLNHLKRNRMIVEDDLYKFKESEILSPIFWLFDYPKINNYVIEKAKYHKKRLTMIYNLDVNHI